FDASGSSDRDEPSGALGFNWTIDGRAAATLDGQYSFVRGGKPGEARVTFVAAGRHAVAVKVVDRRGAPSQEASIDVEGANAPPQAEVLAVSPATGCGDWVVGTRITLEAVADGVDPDASCDGK